MNRVRRSASLIAASVGAAVLAPALVSCASTSEPDAGNATTTTASQVVAEDAFLAQTAAHVCEVQDGVYATQKQLRKAYASLAEYVDIDTVQVDELTSRLRDDPDFSDLLNKRILSLCG